MVFRFEISDPDNVGILFILTIIQGMLYSGPFSRVGLNEMAVEGGGDSKVLLNMFTAYTLFQCTGSTFFYYLIGYLMEQCKRFVYLEKTSFFIILFVNSAVLLATSAFRRKFYIHEEKT